MKSQNDFLTLITLINKLEEHLTNHHINNFFLSENNQCWSFESEAILAQMEAKTEQVIKLLSDLVCFKTQIGNTVLHYAAFSDCNNFKDPINTFAAIIDSGANVNAQTNNILLTPLHLAAQINNINIARLLIAKGANINAQTNAGLTPLHLAVINENSQIVEILIEAKADLAIKDNKKKTALMYANKQEDTRISSMLDTKFVTEKKMFPSAKRAKVELNNDRDNHNSLIFVDETPASLKSTLISPSSTHTPNNQRAKITYFFP